MQQLWFLAIPLLIALAAVVEALLRRGRYRPLAAKFARRHPAPGQMARTSGPVHGAVDTEGFRRALRHNSGGWGPVSGLGFGNRDDDGQAAVLPMPEDETYAARFHAAFGKDKERQE